MKKILVLLFLFSLIDNILAQDTLKINNSLKLFFNVEFKQLYQNTPFSKTKLVDPIVDISRPVDTNMFNTPFMHNSLFFGLGTKILYKDKIGFNFKVYLEQRAWSYGVNNKGLNTVFSNFQFTVRDSLLLFKKRVKYNFIMGDIYDADEVNYGLRAYNIDIQGVDARIDLENYSASFLYSADMEVGIGLNINEYFRLLLEKKFNKSGNFTVGLTTDYMWYTHYPNNSLIIDDRYSYGFVIKLRLTKNLKGFIIGDYFPNAPTIIERNYSNGALLLKADYETKSLKSKLLISPRFRYYGINYRFLNYQNNFYNYTYRYRNDRSPIYPGGIMYPLKNYFRPVSQFAFYSEYQNVFDVFSLELYLDWDYTIHKKLHHRLNTEIISIHRMTNKYGNYYTYLYYTSYLYYNIFKGFNAGIYISNKQMNRDVQYQTFYQMKYPFFGFHFTYDGSFRLK
jgi:hypothetical protein